MDHYQSFLGQAASDGVVQIQGSPGIVQYQDRFVRTEAVPGSEALARLEAESAAWLTSNE